MRFYWALRKGGLPRDRKLMMEFQWALDSCRLVNLGYTGEVHVEQESEGGIWVCERLDWVAATSDWLRLFPGVRVVNLPTMSSDHLAELHATHMYLTSCFRLLESIVDDLQRICSRLLWGSEEGGSKIHWMAWSRLCAPKFEGGLGFREFRSFNDALLAKNLWRILQQPHSRAPAVPALKAKYFPTSIVLTAGLCRRPSYLWRSLMDARSLLSLHL